MWFEANTSGISRISPTTIIFLGCKQHLDFTNQSWCFNGLVLYTIPTKLSFWDNLGWFFGGWGKWKITENHPQKWLREAGDLERENCQCWLLCWDTLESWDGWKRDHCKMPTAKNSQTCGWFRSACLFTSFPHHAPSATMGPYYFGWWLSWQSWSLPWWSAPTFVRPTPKTRRRTPGKCWLWKLVAGVNWNVTLGHLLLAEPQNHLNTLHCVLDAV